MNDFLLIFEDCSCKYICKPTEHKAREQAKELNAEKLYIKKWCKCSIEGMLHLDWVEVSI